jgi:hypothetical protein
MTKENPRRDCITAGAVTVDQFQQAQSIAPSRLFQAILVTARANHDAP